MTFLSSLGARFTRLFRRDDADMRLIRAASQGENVDSERLAKAYWRKYHGTYRKPAEWRSLSPARRDAIYRKRLHLTTALHRFPAEQRDWVRDAQPSRPDDWRPPRRMLDLE
jgi:hypothetical protein